MSVDAAYPERNDRSLERLRRVISEMPEDRWTDVVDGDWTAGVLLAHMAFWDRFVRERWDDAHRRQTIVPVEIDLGMADLVNDASLPGWALIPPRAAAAMAVTAAEEANAVIAALDNDAIEAVIAGGWDTLIDRSLHRDAHIAALERHLSPPAPG